MSNGNVVELNPVKEPVKPQLIVGVVPCLNYERLREIADIIMPGLKEELADKSMGEFTAHKILGRIHIGSLQLIMAYLDFTLVEKVENQQKWFSDRLFSNPAKDYAGFSIVDPFREEGFHIFAVYVKPEFRQTNIMQLGLEYLTTEAARMGSPYISLATRHDASGGLGKYGFMESTSYYRKKLKE